MFVFSTGFSSFDTLLAVYTGTEVSGLAEVASNDEAVGFDTTRSRVAFPASEGTTCAIALDGFGGKTGRSELRWRRGQANDLFASPEVIEGPAGSLARANTGATIETFEPSPWGSTSSVWFAWTTPASGTVKFSTTENNVDTVIGVYTGTTLEDLTTIATNDDDPVLGCCGSFVGFEAVAGTAYRIAVGGYGSDEGTFTLSWSPLIVGTAGADTLTGTPGTEEIREFGGNDVLNGLGGDDVLIGGPGHDQSFGGGGADVILDWHGRDLLNGGAGADFLMAIDGRPGDTLNGGPGRDTCHRDRADSRRRCP